MVRSGCTFCTLLLGIVSAYGREIIWDNNAALTPVEDGSDMERSEAVRMPNWFLIFPGTKWCGPGDIADGPDDLGEHPETDTCCRAHDRCDDYIGGYETKYNLTNPSFYSRLSCSCDEEFRQCLKDSNSTTSNQVGRVYFVLLGTKCYKKNYPITGCKKYASFPARKCLEYEFDTSGEMKYQWFDVPDY